MNRGFSTKKDLKNEFVRLNTFLNENNINLELVIVGGAAVLLHGINIRITHDIDFINKVKKEIISLIQEKFEYLDINSKVQVAHFSPFFVNWKKYKENIFSFSNLKIFTISQAKLVATKFLSKINDNDLLQMTETYPLPNVSQKEVENCVKEIYMSTDRKTIIINELDKRKFDIIEFYRGMGWEYEKSYIKKLLQK